MTLWRGKHPLVLASQSLTRQALLTNAGIDFEAVAAELDERAVQHGSGLVAPGDIAALRARESTFGVVPATRQICHRRRSDAGAGRASLQQAGRSPAGRGAITRTGRSQP